MKKSVLIILLTSTLLLVGCSRKKQPSTNTRITNETNVGTGTTGQLTKEQIADQEKEYEQKKEAMVLQEMYRKNPPTYSNYNELTAKSLLAAGKNVVLFFHAGRCPTCKSLDSEITAKISTLPANSTILKVDYDTATVLKKKYGVTVQHTLVRVDKDMNLIAKKIGGDISTVATLLK